MNLSLNGSSMDCDDQPFTVVENEQLRKIFRLLFPNIKTISADTARNDIIDAFKEERNKIQNILQNAPGHLAFTLDAWTFSNFLSFLEITVHWISQNWELKEILIDFCKLSGPHSGENLFQTFIQCCDDMRILTKIYNMDTGIINDDEEVTTWVNNDKKIYMKKFFDQFHDVYDVFLAEVVKCKKIEEYIDLEKSIILRVGSVSKPGKIPIRLNKPETKVPAVYYFLSLFLIKFAGVHVETSLEDLEKGLAESALTNELVIQDLENRIRNLEAEVIAKE
ncbi:hypothetical protein RirG_126610 [Rhizophagus irregularis DAOM 197198w]|uniref:Uncharacterized protein n=1 Tax=Rhizophagus irregularis (strain DAOM 197198w) TaxID=1432141 RepID=A0A015MH46_RHIIW|nr:hypothetical protein RirG_126610 [Rhizophagus irregularis DAOM 197198w]